MNVNIQARLRTLAQNADLAKTSACSRDVSQVLGMSETLSASALKLARVVDHAPRVIPTISVSRFASSAETVLSGIQTLIGLYGHNPAPTTINTRIEGEMADTVRGLAAFADQAHETAMQMLVSEMQVATQAVKAWNMPDLDDLDMQKQQDQGLVNAFIGRRDVAAVTDAALPKKGFWGRRDKPSRTDRLVMLIEQLEEPVMLYDDFSDDVIELALDRVSTTHNLMDSNIKYRVQNAADKIVFWRNPQLYACGLIAFSQESKVTFRISEVAPTVLTTVWMKLAHAVCGDATSLRRALAFKDDHDFRSAISAAMTSALGHMEKQVYAGIPVPQYQIDDPVVKAAIMATLNGVDDKKVSSGLMGVNEGFDAFGLRESLLRVMKTHPGLFINASKGGLRLTSAPSVRIPHGVSQMLKDSVSKNIKAVQSIYNKSTHHSETLELSPQAVSLCSRPLTDIYKEMVSIYGNGNTKTFFPIRSVSTDGVDRFVISNMSDEEWADHIAMSAKTSDPEMFVASQDPAV